MIKLFNGDCIEVMQQLNSDGVKVDMIITSPPYFNLREYTNDSKEIGREKKVEDYVNALAKVFLSASNMLNDNGSIWINIDDVYIDKALACIPDKLKIKLSENGLICRNEIIWYKPNAMPSSAKTRFNNDYEKLYFFTKKKDYLFNTQYEDFKSKVAKKHSAKSIKSKYDNIEQESSVRQGMNKTRGTKLLYVRRNLPEQQEFVDFIRSRTNIDLLAKNSDLKRSLIEHWFRRDKNGFAYPSVDDWNKIKWLIDDHSKEFNDIDFKLNDVTIETDDIMKNSDKGRIKRAVWSISTKASPVKHFATYPEELVKTPILSSSSENGVVLDMFMGSGTTGVVCKKLNRNFIGIEINPEYFEIAKQRILNN